MSGVSIEFTSTQLTQLVNMSTVLKVSRPEIIRQACDRLYESVTKNVDKGD